METGTTKSAYLEGVKAASPFMVVIIPFGLVFGVIATEAGLSIGQTFGFSLVVFAGAAQIAALQLMTENAPLIVILGTALAVNTRMLMYSASLTPHLGALPLGQRLVAAYVMVDQVFALSMGKYDAQPEMGLAQKAAFYFGAALPCCVPWCLTTLLGAYAGQSIPDAFALDFAVPITFLALIAPMLKSNAHITGALVSVIVALLLDGLPYNVGLLIAALAAMAAAVQVETWEARAAR